MSKSTCSTFPVHLKCPCSPKSWPRPANTRPSPVPPLWWMAGSIGHDFVAQAVVDGLMQAGMETNVPVLSVSLTPHHYQETDHHNAIYRAHFVDKGREAANAALMITKIRQEALGA